MKTRIVTPAPSLPAKPIVRWPALFRRQDDGALFVKFEAGQSRYFKLFPEVSAPQVDTNVMSQYLELHSGFEYITEPVTITFTP